MPPQQGQYRIADIQPASTAITPRTTSQIVDQSLADFQQKAPAAMGLLAGQAIPGLGAASDAIRGIPSAIEAAYPGVLAVTGKTLAAGAAMTAARKLGVPPEVLTGLMVVAGVRGAFGGAKGGAPEEAPLSQNAGGRLVPGEEPSLEDVVGKALDNLRKPTPPSKITTPPQPTLPPGYTPRTSVPASSPAPSAPTPGPVLNSAALSDPMAGVSPSAPAAPAQALPQAWQALAKPASFPPKEIEGSGLAAAFQQELLKRGMKASEAIPMVLANKALPEPVKAQLVMALEKVARAQLAPQ